MILKQNLQKISIALVPAAVATVTGCSLSKSPREISSTGDATITTEVNQKSKSTTQLLHTLRGHSELITFFLCQLNCIFNRHRLQKIRFFYLLYFATSLSKLFWWTTSLKVVANKICQIRDFKSTFFW